MEIQIKGIEILNVEEKEKAEKLFEQYHAKIQKKLKNGLSLKIHIEEYNKKGKRRKYSINADAVYSGKPFKANVFGWVLADVIHDFFSKILTQTEHEFHLSDQHSWFTFSMKQLYFMAF